MCVCVCVCVCVYIYIYIYIYIYDLFVACFCLRQAFCDAVPTLEPTEYMYTHTHTHTYIYIYIYIYISLDLDLDLINDLFVTCSCLRQAFCDAVLTLEPTELDTVWVQDYHLMLCPKYLRDASPKLSIGW